MEHIRGWAGAKLGVGWVLGEGEVGGGGGWAAKGGLRHPLRLGMHTLCRNNFENNRMQKESRIILE